MLKIFKENKTEGWVEKLRNIYSRRKLKCIINYAKGWKIQDAAISCTNTEKAIPIAGAIPIAKQYQLPDRSCANS